MTATTFASGYLEFPLTGNALFAGGELAAVANPEGVPLTIVDAKLYIVTPTSDAGTTLAVGLAADAVTSDNSLIDALAIDGAITGKAYHGMTALAAKGEGLVWDATEYITATGSAASTAFAAKMYISYVRTA